MSYTIEVVFTDPRNGSAEETSESYVLPGGRDTFEQARHDGDTHVMELPLHRGPALLKIRDAGGAIVDDDEDLL